MTALTAFAAAAAVAGRLPRPARVPFLAPLLAGAAWAGIGLFRSESADAFALVFLPVAGTAAAAVIAAGLGVLPRERARILLAFVLAHLGCSLYGVVQYLGWDPWTWTLDYGRGRVFSTTGNPNFLGGQIALALPVLAALGIGRGRSLAWLARVTCALALMALVYAQTRSAWIGLAAGLVAAGSLAAVQRRSFPVRLRPVLWLAALAGAAAVVYSLPVPGINHTGISLPRQFASVTDLEQQSARQRFFWWRAAFGLFRDSPLAGHGTGDFAREFPPRARRAAPPYYDLYPAFCDHPHNDFLFVASEHGLIGAGLLLWLGAAWIRVLARRMAHDDPLPAGVLAGAVATGVHAVWNMPLEIHSTVFSAGILLGLTGACPGPAPSAARPLPGRDSPWRLVLLGVAAIAVAWRPAALLVPQVYLNGARIMKEKGHYGPAAYLARKTMKMTSAPWRASFLLGGIMYGQRMYAEALEFFARDEAENPWGADAILHQAKVRREQGNSLLTDAGMQRRTGQPERAGRSEAAADRFFDEADRTCRRALRLVPNYPEAAVTIATLAYFRAKAARDAGRPRRMHDHLRHARIWLTYALRFFPRHAEGLKLLGFVEVMAGDWVRARDAWSLYVEARPDDHQMRQRLEALRDELPRLVREGGKR